MIIMPTYLKRVQLIVSKYSKKQKKPPFPGYIIYKQGGYTHIGIAKDEFPTDDGLALIPYIRESRRVGGIDRLYEYDLSDPYALKERPLYKSSIAVGDYPLDHHRKKNPEPKQIDFPSIPSYSVPYGALIPEKVNGLIVAEKYFGE